MVADFYDVECLPSYEEVQNLPVKEFNEKYIELDMPYYFYNPKHMKGSLYLHKEIYYKRMRYVIEGFLLEANDRAKSIDRIAYVHAVGLGLGVWQVDDEQTNIMMDVYSDVISAFELPYISDVDFSWFQTKVCGGAGNGDTLKDRSGHAINIWFSKRNPADKVDQKEENGKRKLLVAMYAWDSNSYPGNEYWYGMLSASGDPAAASCSQISQLQNPDINGKNINGDKVRFWSGKLSSEKLSSL